MCAVLRCFKSASQSNKHNLGLHRLHFLTLVGLCSCPADQHTATDSFWQPVVMITAAGYLDTIADALTVVLQSDQSNALHDAATFSRLLCVSQQLKSRLLSAAAGRLTLKLPARGYDEVTYGSSLVQWMMRHIFMGNLKCVKKDNPASDLQDYATQANVATILAFDEPDYQLLLDRVAGALGTLAASPAAVSTRLPVVEFWYGVGEYAVTVSLGGGAAHAKLCRTAPCMSPGKHHSWP